MALDDVSIEDSEIQRSRSLRAIPSIRASRGQTQSERPPGNRPKRHHALSCLREHSTSWARCLSQLSGCRRRRGRRFRLQWQPVQRDERLAADGHTPGRRDGRS